MNDLYKDIRDDLKYVADYFESRGITYRSFNAGVQFNALDDCGVWHSYYPTTGTVIVNKSNDRKDHAKKVFHNKSLEEFANAMYQGEVLQKYFK